MQETKQLNILLADDDTDDCFFFKMALDALTVTHKLATVADGEKLMTCLLDHAAQLPDILFLDLNMPRKNGFECLTEIKNNPILKSLPVIIYSTSFEIEVVNQLYLNGAQYFMRKPPEFSQLKKIIADTFNLISKQHISQPSMANFILEVQPV